jgi:hypothetical protein
MEIAMEITNDIQFSPISVNLFFLWRDEPSSSIGSVAMFGWSAQLWLAKNIEFTVA